MCSRSLVFRVCLLGEAIYQHVVFGHGQAHTLLCLSLGSRGLWQGSSYCSFLFNLKPLCFLLCTPAAKVGIAQPVMFCTCVFVCFLWLTRMGNFPSITRRWVFRYRPVSKVSLKVRTWQRCDDNTGEGGSLTCPLKNWARSRIIPNYRLSRRSWSAFLVTWKLNCVRERALAEANSLLSATFFPHGCHDKTHMLTVIFKMNLNESR